MVGRIRKSLSSTISWIQLCLRHDLSRASGERDTEDSGRVETSYRCRKATSFMKIVYWCSFYSLFCNTHRLTSQYLMDSTCFYHLKQSFETSLVLYNASIHFQVHWPCCFSLPSLRLPLPHATNSQHYSRTKTLSRSQKTQFWTAITNLPIRSLFPYFLPQLLHLLLVYRQLQPMVAIVQASAVVRPPNLCRKFHCRLPRWAGWRTGLCQWGRNLAGLGVARKTRPSPFNGWHLMATGAIPCSKR